MARWGEGDPRWIVEERPDATNVNNWHWTEKNADAWSKKKLEELFVNLVIEDAHIGNVLIEEMEKCEGEARVNNRKAKLIFFYEWEIVLKWKGFVNGNNNEVTGKLEILNLSEEHEDVKDVDLQVSLSTGSVEGEALKEMLRIGRGAGVLRDQMVAYINALKLEFSEGVILPKKDGSFPASSTSSTKSVVSVNRSKIIGSASDQMNHLDPPCKVDFSSIELNDTFKCSGQELFNVLTQREMLQIFTGGEVKLKEAKQGEPFEMLNGVVSGIFVDLVPFTRVSQKWRLKTWPAGHYSDVVIDIEQRVDDTKIRVMQTNVPDKEVENTRMGWKRYYFEAIKRVFGFGLNIL